MEMSFKRETQPIQTLTREYNYQRDKKSEIQLMVSKYQSHYCLILTWGP